MAIYISQSAAKEIERIRSSRQQPDSLVRVRVKTGGCSGLFYVLKLESPQSKSLSAPASEERIYEVGEISFIVDVRSDGYLQDLRLDYSEDLMGGGFRFQNSLAIETCDCGLSFTIE